MNYSTMDLTGQRYARLRALKHTGFDKFGKAFWQCVCDCGKRIVTRANALRTGNTQSCGCLQIEVTVAQATTHGHYRSRLYSIYHCMLQRCHNPKNSGFYLYGARGIAVCKKWRAGFVHFLADMAEGYRDDLSIDRIDNTKGYSRANCRWATAKEQAQNRRTTKRRA